MDVFLLYIGYLQKHGKHGASILYETETYIGGTVSWILDR